MPKTSAVAAHRQAVLALQREPANRAMSAAADAEILADISEKLAAVRDSTQALKVSANDLLTDMTPRGLSFRIHVVNLEQMVSNIVSVAGELITAANATVEQYAAEQGEG